MFLIAYWGAESELISIRDKDPRPIYLQIVGEIKEQIRSACRKLRDQGVITFRLGQRAKAAPERLIARIGLLGIPVLRLPLCELGMVGTRAFSPLANFGGWQPPDKVRTPLLRTACCRSLGS